MKIKLRVLLCLLLITTLVLPGGFMGKSAEAASKPSIEKSLTIPIGKITAKTVWSTSEYNQVGPFTLSVSNKVKGAKYTFSSSNSKIVSVASTGNSLTGVKAGSAKITCKQTVKGKTTTVGTCKVTVKKAGLAYNSEFVFGVGTNMSFGYETGYDESLAIIYRNPDAKYTYTTDSANLKITEQKITKDLERFTGRDVTYLWAKKYTAKAAGTYTVTVKETYNKKTTKVGTFKFVVVEPKAVNTEIGLNQTSYCFNTLVTNAADASDFTFEVQSGSDVLAIEKTSDGYYMTGKAEGTATVKIYDTKRSKEVGIAKVTVVRVPAESIDVQESAATYVGDEYFELDYDVEPWETTDTVNISSSDSGILKVECLNDGDGSYWKFTPVGEGTATITFTCGDKSATCTVTVYADEDAYYDNY